MTADGIPGAATSQPLIRAADDMAAWDAVTTARRIADGDVNVQEVVDAAVDRAEALNPKLGAMFVISREHAHAALARRADQSSGRPLHGVPTAVKDLSDLRGLPTTFGSRATGVNVSQTTGPTVRQLLSTGLISIGKSAASEWGMNPSGESLGFAPTRNPWNPEHTCGGSSSGAGALAAAHIVPIAHAADGGGSIRIPAACCGLVGLKPTLGRLALSEDMRLLPIKLVSSGVLTRTVADTRAHLQAAERHHLGEGNPPLTDRADPRRCRIAVVTTTPHASIDSEVVAATRRTAAALADAGHDVVEHESLLPESLRDDFLLYWGTLAQGIAGFGFVEIGTTFRPRLLEPWSKGLARHARVNAHRLPGALRRLRRFRDIDYPRLMESHDVILTPTIGTPPPPLGWLRPDQPFDELLAKLDAFVPFTPAWNVAGAPAISVPAALSAAGLPIGVQMGAASGDDTLLLDLAAHLEESQGFNIPL